MGMNMARLVRWQHYSRRAVHDLFDPLTDFQPQTGTWGLQGTVRVPGRPHDWVFFVTLGRRQGEYQFEEGVTEHGVLTWQSQPHQTLRSHPVLEWVQQDPLIENIFLFLRADGTAPYWFMGKLAYLDHDEEQEEPVHFHWQILDWQRPPEAIAHALRIPTSPSTSERFVVCPPDPAPPAIAKDPRSVSPSDVRKGSRDYVAEARENSELGRWGETWVYEYERQRWAHDPERQERVVHVAAQVGDGLGHDVLSVGDDGERLYIEVKTTRGRPSTPWYMTKAEMRFASDQRGSYALYRLYGANPEAGSARFFILTELGDDIVAAEPISFQVSVRPSKGHGTT